MPPRMWLGVRTSRTDAQEYYTNEELARRVAALAAEEGRPFGKSVQYVDVGVGDGAIYGLLPSPKAGIELSSDVRPRLRGVRYGQDVFAWTPPASWAERDVVVAMNPPFAQQVKVLNACAAWRCRSLTVVWIAGAAVRLWGNEDGVDRRMHLVREYRVPTALSRFRRGSARVDTLRTVVQVWRRDPTRQRRLWSELEYRPDESVPRFSVARATEANVALCCVGSLCKIGKAGVMGRDVVAADGQATLTEVGHRRLAGVVPPGCPPRPDISHLGTIRGGNGNGGTAMLLRADDAASLVRALNARTRGGLFKMLLRDRQSSHGFASLSQEMLRRMLSRDWERLDRPLEDLPQG